MRERRYLLDIRQMLEGDGSEAVLQEALARIDRERRQKALPLKNARVQAASVGAGLLIQRALTEDGNGGRVVQRFSVEELLSVLCLPAMEVCYQYGKNGKPYLEASPFYFNLSHSGDYVFCGVSEQEIGVDIQKLQGDNELGLAGRFFSSAEYQALEARGEAEDRRRMFFRMWTRKEAYGKLTGEGISGVMGKDLWTGAGAWETIPADGAGKEASRAVEFRMYGPEGKELLWEEYEEPSGYQMAVCRYGI